MARPLAEVEVHLVRTLDDAAQCKTWLSERHGTDTLALDTETSGLSATNDFLRLVQIGDTEQAWVIPAGDWGGLAKEILLDWEGHWVGHNMMFDLRFLEANGYTVPRHRLHDTKIVAHLDNPIRSNSLKPLSVSHLDKKAAAGQELLHEGMKQQGWTWGTVPLEFTPYWFYGGMDCVLTARLWEQFQPVRAEYAAAYELEMATALICSDMSMRGMRVDRSYLDAKLIELDQFCDDMAAWIKDNYNLSPGSNDAVANRLVADGVRLEVRTESGKWSVTAEVLEGIDHPLAKAVLEHRQVRKVASTYFLGVQSRLDGDILRADINPLAARTGRMSVSKPALQQLPSGSALVRDMFIPREGNRLVLCDLDQIEMRMLAHLAGEESMIAAIRGGEDLHWAAARVMYGPGATAAQRRTVKNGSFAVLYGAGKDKIAAQQGVSVAEAEAFLAHYAQAFPGVAALVRNIESVARQRMQETGTPYIVLADGRKLPMDKDKLYTGVNYASQGGAALIFKQGLVRMAAAGVSEFLTVPVHDEVQADVPANLTEDVARTIEQCMSDATSLVVPVTASAAIVDRWGEKYAA